MDKHLRKLKGKNANSELAKSIIKTFYSSTIVRDDDFLDGKCDDSPKIHGAHAEKDIQEAERFWENDGYDDYVEQYEKASHWRQRFLKHSRKIRNIAFMDFKWVEVDHTSYKISKQKRKMENRFENAAQQKSNKAKKLSTLGLRRRNEQNINSNEFGPYNDVVNSNSCWLGNRTQDFVNLQYREFTPSDYDLLLILDEMLPKQVLPKKILKRLEAEKVPTWMKCDVCCICLERFDEMMKRLPNYGHCFHVSCIDVWLGTKSIVCPIDMQKVIL